jgi:FkbM family methyltransferase
MVYKTVKFLNNISSKYLNYLSKKSDNKLDKLWLKKFPNSDYFDYKIELDITIRLYKDSILSKLIFQGFELDEIDFLKKILKPGDFFIDIGCNVGLFSLIASQLVGEKGKVICFEPTPKTFKRLKENIELNSFNNIDSKNIGLSNEIGQLFLNQSENGFDAWNTFASNIDYKFQNKVKVDVSTLDNEIQNLDKNKISLIKIDVEGWEKFVLEGAKEILVNYSPVLLIEFTESNTFAAGYMVQEIYMFLTSLGYKWFSYIDGKILEEPMKLNYPYNNLIATKDESKLFFGN